MCGIAGFVDGPSVTAPLGLEPTRGLLHQMCEVIRHRGPDDEGLWVSEGVALGMRRLSIIDLATGHQPIFNEDRTVWTVFNGEIYNFRELREELVDAGHRFSTATDTEVIVHAYEQWGEDAIVRFRGMFGLALWDDRRRTLLVARDRMGIKPLYYTEAGGRLYFGSEIKSLLCAPDVPREIDLEALDHYLSFLYTPRGGSIFQGIRKLPPGHLLVWRQGHATYPTVLAADRGRNVCRQRTRGRRPAAYRIDRCRALASGQRCAARRLPVWRARFESGRRFDEPGVRAAGQDLLDRLR
jgi:asparagine synthase (glutamine-hydrolysing)